MDPDRLPKGFADKIYHDDDMKISMHASQAQPFVAHHTPSLPESVAMAMSTPPTQEKESVPELPVVAQGTGAKEKEWILQAALAVSTGGVMTALLKLDDSFSSYSAP